MSLLGPNGTPVSAKRPAVSRHTFAEGEPELEYFKSPEVAWSCDASGLPQWSAATDHRVQALVRQAIRAQAEVQELRKRVEDLERMIADFTPPPAA